MKKLVLCLSGENIGCWLADFPDVDWVVHIDCPTDVNTYIHRSGRTARCEKQGTALLVLLPSEAPEMVRQLTEKKVPIKKIK